MSSWNIRTFLSTCFRATARPELSIRRSFSQNMKNVTLEYNNGDKYEGGWSDDQKNGRGTLFYKNGGKYVGEWVNNLRDGFGVNTWRNGNRYTGNWKQNVKHGQGKFTYVDGGEYVGEWANDQREGEGVNTWTNGDQYEGNWENNQMHGTGIFSHADGRKDEGEWVRGKKKGAGSTSHKKENKLINAKNGMQFQLCWIGNKPALIVLMPKSPSVCPYLELAHEFVLTLKWDENFFDSSFNRCYCPRCYKEKWHDVIDAGEGKYVIPRGWVRLGLRIDSVIAKTQEIWNKWIVTFHGTTKIAAQSILGHRQFCWPGDTLIDGTKLRIRQGHIPGQNHLYTSPTIAYSSSLAYSPVYDFQSGETDSDYQAQIVLQCRQKPKSFDIGPETIGAEEEICPHVSNSEIEYFTDRRGSLVAYGLLVRFRQKNLWYFFFHWSLWIHTSRLF